MAFVATERLRDFDWDAVGSHPQVSYDGKTGALSSDDGSVPYICELTETSQYMINGIKRDLHISNDELTSPGTSFAGTVGMVYARSVGDKNGLRDSWDSGQRRNGRFPEPFLKCSMLWLCRWLWTLVLTQLQHLSWFFIECSRCSTEGGKERSRGNGFDTE